MTKYIIDTDPGVDDAIAILLAHQLDLPLLGLTLLAGNVDLDQAKVNAFRLAKFLKRRFPIYLGSEGPLEGDLVTAGNIHGEDGLGNSHLPFDSYPEEGGAVDFLVQAAQDHEDLCIFALGPLTNIARALAKNPQAFKKTQLILMGGAYKVKGNTSAYAEFNFFVDPLAAETVLSTFPGHISVVPLDVTSQCVFSMKDIQVIAGKETRMGDLLTKICRLYMDAYLREEGIHGCYINDPMTILLDQRPDLFAYEEARIGVVTQGEKAGQVIPYQGDGREKIQVFTQVDSERLMDFFRDCMSREVL